MSQAAAISPGPKVAPRIPLVDLTRQEAGIRDEVRAAMDAVIAGGRFIQGPAVREFECRFAAAIGAPHGVGCSSGTAALALALEVLGVGRGDEVVTVAHTFFATAEAICAVGATPVFADIDPATYAMDPASAAAVVTPRTAAIVPVHIYGTPAPMDALCAMASRHALAVIEDAAQAHLAGHGDAFAGTLGDAGAFSFYPGKNLGAYGDAGFLTVRDSAAAEAAARMADHGRGSKYEHQTIGFNHRLDALQAAVLTAKLPRLAAWNDHRRQMARRYDAALRRRGFQVIEAPEGTRPVYHLYVVQVSNRDEVMARLADAGIATGIHYPVPCHLQPALAHLGGRPGQLPVTERAAARVLSLPICGAIDPASVDEVCERLCAVARP